MKGQTPGKVIGRLFVVTASDLGERPAFLDLCMREIIKAFCFFSIIGWCVGLVNMIITLCLRRSLHDLASKTTVIFARK